MSNHTDTPEKNGSADNVVHLNFNAKRTPKKRKKAAARDMRWSSKKINFVEVDLCADPDGGLPQAFMMDEGEFRIYFDNPLAAETAHAFFGVMNLSLAEFVTERPHFDAIILEFDAMAGRFFLGSVMGTMCFYCESDTAGGMLMPLQV